MLPPTPVQVAGAPRAHVVWLEARQNQFHQFCTANRRLLKAECSHRHSVGSVAFAARPRPARVAPRCLSSVALAHHGVPGLRSCITTWPFLVNEISTVKLENAKGSCSRPQFAWEGLVLGRPSVAALMRGEATLIICAALMSQITAEPQVAVDPSGSLALAEEVTILQTAVQQDREDIVSMILEPCLLSGIDLDAVDAEGRTPLQTSILNSNSRVFDMLLACGASVEVRSQDQTGGSALHVAIAQLQHAFLRRLLAGGISQAGLDALGNDGLAPLHVAAWLDTGGVAVRLLLDAGATVETRNPFTGDTALHYAARYGNTAAANHLIASGAAVDGHDFSGVSSLQMATWHGHQTLSRTLSVAGGRASHTSSGLACARSADQSPLVQNGGVQRMFERAANVSEFSPTVLNRDPWVLQLDDFLSEEEAARLVKACGDRFEQSVHESRGSSVRTVRSSLQCWYTPRPGCSEPSCHADALLQQVQERVAALTLAPTVNLGNAQIVRYDPGGFYATHHVCCREAFEHARTTPPQSDARLTDVRDTGSRCEASLSHGRTRRTSSNLRCPKELAFTPCSSISIRLKREARLTSLTSTLLWHRSRGVHCSGRRCGIQMSRPRSSSHFTSRSLW